jgi:hypothetical protein
MTIEFDRLTALTFAFKFAPKTAARRGRACLYLGLGYITLWW